MTLRPVRTVRLAAAVAATVVVAGIAGACGGGGDDASGDSLQDRAATLSACLNGAGAQGSERDSTPFGVETPVLGVTVAGLEQADEAQVWLFETADDARAARPLITLANEDDQRNSLVGRTVVRFNNVPSDADRATIDGCLVAPVV